MVISTTREDCRFALRCVWGDVESHAQSRLKMMAVARRKKKTENQSQTEATFSNTILLQPDSHPLLETTIAQLVGRATPSPYDEWLICTRATGGRRHS